MPTNYAGSATATQSPSPAPGPGTIPIGSLPADGDPRSAASVNQDFKVSLDYAAHLQGTAKWRPPRASASGQTGFTAVTHTGTGLATIAPTAVGATQSQPTYTPYNLVFKIIAGGAVGTATFQVSLDGGNTYGSTVTSAATYLEPTSGVTVTMSSGPGNFAASDTYSFSGADAAMAGFVDSGANNHGLVVDHLGFPCGKRGYFHEDWGAISSTATATTSQNNVLFGNGRWFVTTGTTGTVAWNGPGQLFASYPSASLTLATGNTNGSKASLNTNGQILQAGAANGLWVLQFDWGFAGAAGANNLKCWGGWAATAPPDGGGEMLAFFWNNGTLNFQDKLAVQALNFTPSANTLFRCRIEYGGASTVLGGYVRAFINENLVYVNNTTVSAAIHYLTFENLAIAGSPTTSLQVGEIDAGWGTWLNPGLLG